MPHCHRDSEGAAPRARNPPAACVPIALIVFVLVALMACSRREPPQDQSRPKTRLVADGLGRRVRIPVHPGRIVSLAPNVTDAILALGLVDRLVGITDFCRLPAGTPPVRRVGGMLDPDLETIRALRPDLLVGSTSGNDPGFATQAAALGLPFYALHAPDVESVLNSLQDLASSLGEPARGEELRAALQRRLDAVARRVEARSPARVLFVVWGDPLVVPGRTAFLTDALRRAGGVSITADAAAAWPAFDVELAIARAPEVILTTADSRSTVERLERDGAWREVPAVRLRRVHIVSDAIQQPGPRVVDGIEEAARCLHPEAFTDGGSPLGATVDRPTVADRPLEDAKRR